MGWRGGGDPWEGGGSPPGTIAQIHPRRRRTDGGHHHCARETRGRGPEGPTDGGRVPAPLPGESNRGLGVLGSPPPWVGYGGWTPGGLGGAGAGGQAGRSRRSTLLRGLPWQVRRRPVVEETGIQRTTESGPSRPADLRGRRPRQAGRQARSRVGSGRAEGRPWKAGWPEDRKDPPPDADALGGTRGVREGEGRVAVEGGPRPAVEGGPSSVVEGGWGDVRASAGHEGVLSRCLEMGTIFGGIPAQATGAPTWPERCVCQTVEGSGRPGRRVS